MIILVGSMRVAPGKREDTLIALVPLIEASRAEAGCLGFSLAFDIMDDQVLRVFEAFEDEHALEAHRMSAHVAEWEAAASLLGISDVDLSRHDAPLSSSSFAAMSQS